MAAEVNSGDINIESSFRKNLGELFVGEVNAFMQKVLESNEIDLEARNDLYRIFYDPQTRWSSSGFYRHFVLRASSGSTLRVSTLLEMLKVIDQWDINTFENILGDNYLAFESTEEINTKLDYFKEDLINSFLEAYVKERYTNTKKDTTKEERHLKQLTLYYKLFRDLGVSTFTELKVKLKSPEIFADTYMTEHSFDRLFKYIRKEISNDIKKKPMLESLMKEANEVYKYLKENGYISNYHKDWRLESTMMFHSMLSLPLFAGFSPIFFEFVGSDFFDSNSEFDWLRHHWKEWIESNMRKGSISLFDSYITNNKLHGQLKRLEGDIKSILRSELETEPTSAQINERLEKTLTDAMIAYLELTLLKTDVTPDILVSKYESKDLGWLLESYMKIYDSSRPDGFKKVFLNNLRIFNEFKQMIQRGRIFEWLKDNIPSCLERFNCDNNIDRTEKLRKFLNDKKLVNFEELARNFIAQLKGDANADDFKKLIYFFRQLNRADGLL